MHSLQEGVPVLSFNPRLSTDYTVNYAKLQRGISSTGFPSGDASRTSIYFNEFNPRIFGSSISDPLLMRLMFRLPALLSPAIEEQGLGRHQAGYDFKVAVNVHPEAVIGARDDLRETHEVDKRKVKKLTNEDVISLIMAHELRELELRKSMPKRHAEPTVRKYIAECVQLGNNNPWLGVIRPRTR